MGTGFLRLLRWLAVLGMAMAAIDFAIAAVDWAAPPSGFWFGKRMKDAIVPAPRAGPPPDQSIDVEEVQRQFRNEMRGLYRQVRESSQWFCVAGIFYLVARRQTRIETATGPDNGH